MRMPMVATRIYRLDVRPTLRTITVATLAINALSFLFDIFAIGPNEINVSHVIIKRVVAGIVALRLRWTPVIGALLGALLIIEGSIFIGRELSEPTNTAAYASAAIFFATAVVALVVQAHATGHLHLLLPHPRPHRSRHERHADRRTVRKRGSRT